MRKEYKVSVDLYDNFVKGTSIHFVSGDSETMLLRVKLLEMDEPFKLKDSDVVEFIFENTPGVKCIGYANIADCEQGEVTYALKDCQAVVGGETEVGISVIRELKRLSWRGFRFFVKGNEGRSICAALNRDIKDGETPRIGENGNWWIGETDTGASSKGADGEPGADGETPRIGENGNWWIGETDTGASSKGADGEPGKDGEPGADGETPHIGENGNWWIGETDTGACAKGIDGEPGKDGETPHIGENGNWWIGETDTGASAKGIDGEPGADGKSAYELAVESGFDGDVDDWLESLKGESGGSGAPGGITIPASGFFTMYVDSEGNLFVVTADEGLNPFRYEDETGNLYYKVS